MPSAFCRSSSTYSALSAGASLSSASHRFTELTNASRSDVIMALSLSALSLPSARASSFSSMTASSASAFVRLSSLARSRLTMSRRPL
eukprot:CAMPEP_0171825106 /NCGR_PEP_ID=MMETSP0992-20121227/5354_1 /TAXON_ID=483369 /ORGANISM="non described non described, Strain CCMP2098" /LENGTH=87 /DNA_ID=CAMNT_0012440003 /DNA_START=595 /DNA_END=854 /DNA_ORIENTATION=+